jgi:hypothetical protein
MTKINSNVLLATLPCALLLTSHARAADPAPAATPPPPPTSLAEAITGGKVGLEFRYRLEDVEQDGLPDDALASTLRTRLNFRTAAWHGWSAFLEADNVFVLGDDEAYNSTRNGEVSRPVVADPEYTEANQFYLQYKGERFGGLLGRQRITLDNHRFVGNVGWRQNEQTFDALTLQSTGKSAFGWHYSYLENVNRVFGPDGGSPPGDLRSDSHVLNLRYDAGDLGKFVGFGYLLDFENAATLSNQSWGLLWTGTLAFNERTKLGWGASWATQGDHGDNPYDIDSDYWYAEGVLTTGPVNFTLGYESLGGEKGLPNRAFQTPLATLHAFQGWADKFLTTPAQGVEDLYLGIGGNLGPVALKLVWHDFGAEATGDDYGSEWDASATWKFAKRYEAMLKVADYQADGFATDTTKWWLQFAAAF